MSPMTVTLSLFKKLQFLGFTMQKYAVNLSGGLNCIDVYAVLDRANDRELYVFAMKHEANTYSEYLIYSHDNVSI